MEETTRDTTISHYKKWRKNGISYQQKVCSEFMIFSQGYRNAIEAIFRIVSVIKFPKDFS